MTPHAELAEVRRDLEKRRQELESDLVRLSAPPVESATVSFGKRVGDGTTEAVERLSTTATARSLSASIAGIDRALEKIDAGDYGRCDGCGLTISPERLEALPAAATCVECAAAR